MDGLRCWFTREKFGMLHGDTKARSFGIQLTVYTSATAFILMTIGWVSSSLSAHASAVHSSIPCHLATVSLVVSFEFVALLSNIVVVAVSLAYTSLLIGLKIVFVCAMNPMSASCAIVGGLLICSPWLKES